MRYAGLRLVVCLVLICATLLGFLIAQDSDEHPGWQGSAVLEISDDRDGVPWERVVATLNAVADRYHAGIIRVDDDFYNGDQLKNVYVAYGASEPDRVEWARGLLAPFGREPARQLSVASFDTRHPLDPRAAYRVFGSQDAAQELAGQLDGLGLSGTLTPGFTFVRVIANYALQSMGLVAALLFGLATLTIGSVLLSTRRYAVWRLHGASVLQMMARDARALAPFCAAAALASGLVVSAFLLWYDEWHQILLFARFAALAAVAMGAVVLLAYALAVVTVSATSVLDALKGRMRLGPALTLLYPLRVVAVLIVVPAVVGIVTDYASLTNRDAARPYAAAVGESVNLTFPGYRTPEESDRNYEEAGAWIRQLDTRGRAVVMKRESLRDYLPASIPVGQTELMWVNNTFLSVQPVRDARGARIGPTPEGTIRVIVPERLRSDADVIATSVVRTFTPETLPAGVKVPHVQRLIAAGGQAVFGYAVDSQSSSPDGSSMNQPMLHDAVIVSIPNGTPLVDDIRLAAWASFHGVVLAPGDVTSSVGRGLPAGSILGMLPVAGVLADNYQTDVRRSISDAAMLGLASFVLVLTATATCLLYARRKARTMFAGHIAGRGFWYSHRRALLLEGVIPLVVLAWVCMDNWYRAREVAAYTDLGMSAPPTTPAPDWWRLIPVTGALLAAMLLFTALLFAAHHRTVTTLSSRA